MPLRPIPALVLTSLLVALAPSTARGDLYNPTTMQDIPSSYYYPAPAPTVDPPPLTFPPLTPATTSTGSSGSSSTGSSSTGRRRTTEQRILGYRRSAKVSRTVNRQMAAVFKKRLGKRQFAFARFIAEADKGTFRKYANGNAETRAAQAAATRQAGLSTFKGDLGLVQLGYDGFEPRD